MYFRAVPLSIILWIINTCWCVTLRQITLPIDHAEGPTWDSRKELLYFVDIHAGNVHSYDPSTEKSHFIHLDGEVSPVVPSEKNPNLLFVGLNRSLVAINWDGKSKSFRGKVLTTVSSQFPTSRFNDGKADSQGRLWFGTMGFEDANGVAPNQGVLYQITSENLKNPRVMIAPVNISNGMAWNKKNDKFFYIDTPSRKVYQYDYDAKSGDIKNGRTIFDLSLYGSIKGSPDGMTIDKDDNLWIALYGGGAVLKVDPKTGHVLQIISIPAEAVTSVMWGGENLDILYITTSRFTLTKEQRALQPLAGSVFALEHSGTSGLKVFDGNIVDNI